MKTVLNLVCASSSDEEGASRRTLLMKVRTANGPHSGPYVPLVPRVVVVNREIELVDIDRWMKHYAALVPRNVVGTNCFRHSLICKYGYSLLNR